VFVRLNLLCCFQPWDVEMAFHLVNKTNNSFSLQCRFLLFHNRKAI
jgi:hypothetical protein